MKCKHCESENIQIVSNYVELKEKDVPAAFGFIFGLAIFLLITFIGIFIDIFTSDVKTVLGILSSVLGVYCLLASILLFLIYGLGKAFLPYKHKTEITAICLDCGQSWVIKEIDLNN